MTKPTAREALDALKFGVRMQGLQPDGMTKDDALEISGILAARVEKVLALLPTWRDGYCGDLAAVIERALNGEEP
jgi:hypothetical protein